MLGKVFGLKKKSKIDELVKESDSSDKLVSPIGNISKMLNTSGRISLQILQKMAEIYNSTEFIRFMRQPALVGSSIQAGSFSGISGASNDERNRTIVFNIDVAEDETSSSEILQHAIYPLVKKEHSSRVRTKFSVGRLDGNDMVMADLAISKHHATLEIKEGNYLIRDLGSTNGTSVNGDRIEKKPMKIQDGDIVGFGRYEFTFLFPESLYNILKS